MRALLLLGPIAAVVLASTAAAQTQPDPKRQAWNPAIGCGEARDNAWKQYRHGRDLKRATVVASLRSLAGDSGSHADLRCPVAELRALYGARAGRQQTLTDIASGASGVGGFGSVTSAAAEAGRVTQTYWGYLALMPVLLTQFNAFEPTRDLYHGAGLGLDLISARYNELNRSIALLERQYPGQAANAPRAGVIGLSECSAVSAEFETIGTMSVADRALISADLRAVEAACSEIDTAQRELNAFLTAAHSWRDLAPAYYAEDVLELDELIRARDYGLRYTPLQTLQGLVASPFQAVSDLISGQEGKTAVNALKAEAAFTGLRVILRPLELPARPRALTPIATRSTSYGTLSAQGAGAPVLRVMTKIDAAHRAVQGARNGYTYQVELAERVRRAANAEQLVFDYQASTQTVSVSLASAAQASPAGAR